MFILAYCIGFLVLSIVCVKLGFMQEGVDMDASGLYDAQHLSYGGLPDNAYERYNHADAVLVAGHERG